MFNMPRAPHHVTHPTLHVRPVPVLLEQEQLPKPSAQAVAQAAQLLRLKTRAPPPARLWRPSRRLCALLNDLREVRVLVLRVESEGRSLAAAGQYWIFICAPLPRASLQAPFSCCGAEPGAVMAGAQQAGRADGGHAGQPA